MKKSENASLKFLILCRQKNTCPNMLQEHRVGSMGVDM